jgi:uncharacterized repeat protein (TIGR01451 family)
LSEREGRYFVRGFSIGRSGTRSALQRSRFIRRFGAVGTATVLVASSMLVFTSSVVLAGAPKGGALDSCGYPTGSVARPNTIFNENEIMRYSAVTADGKGVFLLYNDEHTLTLGQGAISPWSPTYTSGLLKADQKTGPSIGDPTARDLAGRPIYPAAFVTDLGTTVSPGVGSNPTNKAGDWQSKLVGTAANSGANAPSFVAGTWKAYQGPSINTADTVKNNYFMGPAVSGTTPLGLADAVPAGLTNQGFGADIRWNFADLLDKDGNAVIPGHSYRVQFMAHDGDQNQAGGDVGEGCAVFDIANPPATPAIVTTATNAVLPTGTISDSAVLSGSHAGADIGDIVFKVYTTSDCSGSPITGGTKTVTAVIGDGSYSSGEVTVSTAGTYYWQVSFLSSNTGNNGNANAIGGCGDMTSPQHEQSVVTNLSYEKMVSLTGAAGTFSHNVVAAPGDTLYWQITITNDNTVAASGVTVLDDLSAALVANSNADTSIPPCTNGNTNPACFSYSPGVPAAGQSEIEWRGITVPANGTTVLTFHVTLNSTISATTTLDNFVVSPTNNCVAGSTDAKCKTTTDVPIIDIGKTPAIQTVVTGDSATFTITVTNTGNVALTDVHVDDALTADCNKTIADFQVLNAAQNVGNLSLAVGTHVTYTCTTTALTVGFTNSATATGTPPSGPTVSDTDTATVTVIAPKITITKDPAAQSVSSGSSATFTITVTNSGDTPLTSVSVADLLSLDCTRLATNTPANDLGTLAAGAHVTYTCTATAAEVGTGFTNSATACGQPSVGLAVCNTDTADVTISALHTNQDFVPNDTATLSGLTATASGNLVFKLYKGACTTTPLFDSGNVAVSGDGSYHTDNTAKLSTMVGGIANTGGTYNWQITYTGDATNAAITGGCGDENFVVTNN